MRFNGLSMADHGEPRTIRMTGRRLMIQSGDSEHVKISSIMDRHVFYEEEDNRWTSR